jgi:hypothetical protein
MNPKTHTQLPSDHLAEKSVVDQNLNSSPQHPEGTVNLAADRRRKYPEMVAGFRQGKLTAISPAPNMGPTKAWFFRCDCGSIKSIRVTNFYSKNCKSCGCMQGRFGSRGGNYGTPEYKAWLGMRGRCLYEPGRSYPRYGGRGITICDRWLQSADNFIEDMGRRPSKNHSLDRINNNLGYEPSNCRWATRIEQANNKSNNRILTVLGVSKSVAEWSREMSVSTVTIFSRLKWGWSDEDAVMKPIDTRRRKKPCP